MGCCESETTLTTVTLEERKKRFDKPAIAEMNLAERVARKMSKTRDADAATESDSDVEPQGKSGTLKIMTEDEIWSQINDLWQLHELSKD